MNKEKYTIEFFNSAIRKGGYNRLKNMCEHILLRPNDNKLWFGDTGYNNLKAVVEFILEEYKETSLYKYYYDLQKVEHGFCCLERWEKGLLF